LISIGPEDDLIIRNFFKGSDRHAIGRELSNNGTQLYHGQSGWTIVNRHEGLYLLSLDRPGLAEATSGDWRRAMLERSENANLPVLPMSLPAWSSVQAYRKAQLIRSKVNPTKAPKPVHAVWDVNDKFESVFSVDERYYLSGYDDQENPPLYFLCRIPHPCTTVDEARESLKPKSVLEALESGVPVKRQGDVFAIKAGLTKRQLSSRGAKFTTGMDLSHTDTNNPRPEIQIYGTAHTASHLAKMPDGLMLAKGTVWHNPFIRGDHRGPDHAPCDLGRGWWWLTKNTVPTTNERG
jgi:hypothetical protein